MLKVILINNFVLGYVEQDVYDFFAFALKNFNELIC
jgi:hypothetical protein